MLKISELDVDWLKEIFQEELKDDIRQKVS